MADPLMRVRKFYSGWLASFSCNHLTIPSFLQSSAFYNPQLFGHPARPRSGAVMEFGIFSNGFRPHTSAAQTYEEDLQELILADQLGFSSAWISEHHGEPVYINKVDTCPVPELLMAKASGLTKQIRMGAA